jgi:hypothetical protein
MNRMGPGKREYRNMVRRQYWPKKPHSKKFTSRELANYLENIHSPRRKQGNDHERNQRLDHHAELCPA